MPWSKLVDLELDDEDKVEMTYPICGVSTQPDYPWGTRITLTHREMDKMGLSPDDCNVGDLVDMRCFGVVTSVSSSQTSGSTNSCVEIQIQKMSVENELQDDD